MDNCVAIIPARGGSKGIPRKNLQIVHGKPMVQWSVEHALESTLVDRVIVSTDDAEIAECCINAGAEAPFLRPRKLAEDHVLDWPVFSHALQWLQDNDNYIPNLVVHLRPTAPLRQKGWIDSAVGLLAENDQADSVRSVSEVVQHPYRMFKRAADGFLQPLLALEHPEPFLLRRQNLPKLYYYNCVIDVTRRSTILEQNSMTGSRILGYSIDPEKSFDVDTLQDLEIVRHFAKTFV